MSRIPYMPINKSKIWLLILVYLFIQSFIILLFLNQSCSFDEVTPLTVGKTFEFTSSGQCCFYIIVEKSSDKMYESIRSTIHAKVSKKGSYRYIPVEECKTGTIILVKRQNYDAYFRFKTDEKGIYYILINKTGIEKVDMPVPYLSHPCSTPTIILVLIISLALIFFNVVSILIVLRKSGIMIIPY